MPTEMELTLEQTQQGLSYTVLGRDICTKSQENVKPAKMDTKQKRVQKSQKSSIKVKEHPDENEQDSLNVAAGGNLLSKTTREALNIIENKSKVRYSRNRSNASRMNATSSKTDERIDKLADQLSTLVEIVSKKVVTPAPVKVASVCATTGTYNQVNPPNRVSNQMAPPGFAPVQNNGQNRFNQNQVQGNNFRGNNFHGNQGFQAQNNHAPNFQNQGFQNQPFQVPNNQVQQEISNDFSSYKRNNDQMLRNMQNQINSLKGDLKNEIQNTIKSQQAVMMNQQTTFQNNLQNMICGLFQNQASTSGTLPSNTIPNPDGDMKAITKKLTLPDLTPTRMTLELADRSITYPKGLAEDVFVKGGKFHFPTDFVVVDFEADPRVPLILGRSFLRIGHALIDVYGEEITLRVDNEAATFNLDQTTRYSSTNDKSVNRIDIIDAVCEEYAPKLLGFPNSSSGNPTPTSEPFTSEFILEEIKAYLKDDSISPEIDYADFDLEEDICLIEKLLNNDQFQLPLMDLKQSEVTEAKSSIEEPLELELKDLPSHLEYAFLEENDKLPVIIAKEGIVLGYKISKSGIEVDRAKVDVIAKLPHPTTVKGVRSFLGHAGFYRRFIQDFSKIARPMTHLLEKETPFVFSKDCIDAFQTLKKKLTEAPILVVPDWNLPFELMCDASDFAIGAVLGQRKMKHFQPIHYASKTMTEAQIHYTTTEKEMLAVVYAFEKFRPYLVLSKSIVYTDHSALKYLMNKQDAKPRLLRWVLLLQEFDITIRDKKGSENLVADHLSRLENPYKDVLENKDINEHFPLETLGVISSESTPCVCMGKKLLRSLKLAMKDPSGAIIVLISSLEKYLMPVEAKALPINDARVVVKFLNILFADWEHLGAYNKRSWETIFVNDQFAKVMSKNVVPHRLATRLSLSNDPRSREIFLGKLKTRWSGPFTITKVFPYKTIELSQPDGPNFKVNGHRVKHYFEGYLPPKEVQDLHTLPKDE
ncbi:reverse transcriptase domain-containing protein [Tanacetum coccineum]|uniref:RNA-directed DNA polymerase n=1 Tax=Tanacetum coccineum TaxID=301880 RepID=A0ABQ4WHC9_9ASTR